MQSFSERYEAEILNFDREQAVDQICETMRGILRSKLRKRGLVIAVSGGIDSSVSAALAVKAIGAGKCYCIQLPEVDSAEDTQSRSSQLIEYLEVEHSRHNIAGTLDAIGCYDARDEAIKKTFPEYADGWKNKIVIKGGLDGQVNHFMLVVQDPQGNLHEKRLDLREYLQIVAATNYKQRIRKTIEYYHADRLNYAVIGTPNRLEYDQGFFVKNGDGSADLKPIAHLYKTQVYALAKHLGLPDSICNATPTTDTYSLPQGQDEFYFALPYQEMDKALWAHNHGAADTELAEMLNITEDQAKFVKQDIDNKRKTTHYLHAKPYLIEEIPELDL
jgi:NAD+ synthase